MEWLLYAIAIVPAVFLPLITFDIFSLPQTVLLALLSAVGVVGLLGAGDALIISLPAILAVALIGYMAFGTFWAEVQEGARKEFALQFPFLLVFLLAIHIDPGKIHSILLVIYIVGLAIQAYGLLQVFGIDPIFPKRLEMNPKDRRPISSIGNMNFFAAYILPLFWVGNYFVITTSPFFGMGSLLTLFLLWKMKCRGAMLGLIGSCYGFLLFSSVGGFIDRSFLPWILLLGFVAVAAVFGWLYNNWERINTERITTDETTQLATLRYRICFWRSAWRLFVQKPLLGYGLRSYRKLVYFAQAEINDEDPEYLDPERYMTPQPRYVHNDWLEDLVELGIIGSVVRWLLIGSIFYYGIDGLSGDLQFLFLLTGMAAIAIHAVFFFSLRSSASGLIFWLLAGLIISNTGIAMQTVRLGGPWTWLSILLAAFLAAYLWECLGKDFLGSYYFMRFHMAKVPMEKEAYMKKAVRQVPKESMYNTYMLIGHLGTNPMVAYKYALEMWHNWDGMTPGCVMYLNLASATEGIGQRELAFKHYATSYRLLPTFMPTCQKLAELECYQPLPKEGELKIMKQAKEEARLNILLLQKERENLMLKDQAVMANIQNLILQEANKLNIPEGWHYDFQSGQFLSPQELQERQAQMANQPPAEGAQGPGLTLIPGGKEKEE